MSQRGNQFDMSKTTTGQTRAVRSAIKFFKVHGAEFQGEEGYTEVILTGVTSCTCVWTD